MPDARDERRAGPQSITDSRWSRCGARAAVSTMEVLAHISPAHSENINFFGAIEVDIDAELAALGPTGYRPLRVRDTLF